MRNGLKFTYEKAFSERKAGEGNRTPVCSLGSCRSTIELHPLLGEVNSESLREGMVTGD
jgi:hypothetical protein